MQKPKAFIVTDLGFGDSGKGTIVDYLAREVEQATIVRYNGGAQAAHNVVTPHGRHHTFRQFGSGMFVPGSRTHLSHHMLVDPVELASEAKALAELGIRYPLRRLTVDAQALMVTPFHKAANQLREKLRGESAHGTCGMGIGETVADSLRFPDAPRIRDLRDVAVLTWVFKDIQARKREEFQDHFSFLRQSLPEAVGFLESPDYPAVLAEAFAKFARSLNIVSYAYLDKLAYESTLVFEGAQGVLLDEWYGFHPHTTWSTTTSGNALQLLADIDYQGETKRIGVLRAYATRHGAGPFVTHDEDLSRLLPDAHNNSEGWQGEFRTGWFDTVMARYALEANVGVDAIAITHLDRYQSIAHPQWCTSYDVDGTYVRSLRLKTVKHDLIHQEMLTELVTRARPVLTSAPKDSENYLALLETELSVPVALMSYGQTALEKIWRNPLDLTR